MRLITEEEMTKFVKTHEKALEQQEEQSRLDGIANLHEEQALKIHKEETDAINDK
tara:strand:+ start:720 stop:884 length:165 start_codon:yes stop_codon:yes gene_type:complete